MSNNELEIKALQLAKQIAIEIWELDLNSYAIAENIKIECVDVNQFNFFFGQFGLPYQTLFMEKIKKLKNSPEKVLLQAMVVSYFKLNPISGCLEQFGAYKQDKTSNVSAR